MDARAALANGDTRQGRRCVALVWERLQPRLRLRIARKVPRQEVDDVCSTVAEQFVGYVYESAEVPRSAAALAFAIADRRVADRTRAAKNAAEPVAEIGEQGATDGELEAVLDRAVADQLFASLDERSADVMRRSLAGEPAEEIARDLGITRGHLDVIAHRARKRLMQVLEEAR